MGLLGIDRLLQEYILQAQDLLEDGSSIAQSGSADSIGVKEMCKVLKSTLDGFTTKLEARRVSLVTCMEFHQMVRQVLVRNHIASQIVTHAQ